jgi:hypothetical protein
MNSAAGETKIHTGEEPMKEQEKTRDDDEEARAATDGIGDVETAGETTAAAAIKGPTDTRPVGADTMVKVADSSDSTEERQD